MVEVRDTEKTVLKWENNDKIIEKSEVQKILDSISEKPCNVETLDELPLITYPIKNPLYTLYIVGKETMKKMFYGDFK